MPGHGSGATNRVVIVIAYRPTSPSRYTAFQHVHKQALQVGYPVIVHDSGDEPFSIARTWNQLSDKADDLVGGWKRLVRWGADFLVEDISQIVAAVEHPGDYVLAHDQNHRQTRQEALSRTIRFEDGPGAYGGPNAVSRALWDAVGGFDERFVGYGAEDYAFVHGMKINGFKKQRVPGRQTILWHSVGKRKNLSPTDRYMERREPNLKLFRERIEPITDLDSWNEHLRTRYSRGRDNPFHPMTMDERKRFW